MLPFAIGYRRTTKKPTSPSSKTDYWKYKGDNLESDPQTQTKLNVTYLNHNGYNAAFGALSVNSGKHIWKIKIVKKTTKMCIGVSSSHKPTNCNFHRQRSYANYGYNWNASKVSHNTKYQHYGEPIKTGQIITVILDLDKQQLSFMNDDHHLGVAFNDVVVGQSINYRIAISIVDQNDKVQLIGYGKLNDDIDSDCDMNSNSKDSLLSNSTKDESKADSDEKKDEIDTFEYMELNIDDMESWDHKMCTQWIRNTINKETVHMDGVDLLKILNQLQYKNGILNEYEALKFKCDKQSNMLQSSQNKIDLLNTKNCTLEQTISNINDEKDNLLSLYQVKEEEIQISKMENQRLRSQLFRLQRNLTGS